MSGQWAGSTRAARLPVNWDELRAARLDYDQHRCTWYDHGQRCTNEATEVDHRKPMTDDHRLEALRSLCTPHHSRKSSAEGNAARWKFTEKRPKPTHPGLT
jgi:5-methylcytosine-specific restriction protein A